MEQRAWTVGNHSATSCNRDGYCRGRRRCARRVRASRKTSPTPLTQAPPLPSNSPLASQVELAIYSISGQRVRTLIRGSLPAGHHRLQWDGHNDRDEPVASGAYLYQLSAGDFVATRQLTLLK